MASFETEWDPSAPMSLTESDRHKLVHAVRDAVLEGLNDRLPTEKQLLWVELAIEREAQSIAFRRAVIEKTTAALIWSFLVGAGAVVMEYLRTHGWK